MKKKIVILIFCTLLTAVVALPGVASLEETYHSKLVNTAYGTFQVKCAFSGEGDNLDNWAKTPKLDLYDIQAPRLEINTQYEILHLGDDDYGYVKVSNDSGSTWTTLQKIQGYNPLWTKIEMNLEKWDDEEIIIAFEYFTESNSISDGWYIREITVRGIVEEVYYEDFTDYDPGDSWDDWTITYQTQIPNAPPDRPSINGKTKGTVGEIYEYDFFTTDADEDMIYYNISWGDGNVTGWLGPYESGKILNMTHNWSEEGTYQIKAKAKDTNDEESKWGFLEIEMPVNQPQSQSNNQLRPKSLFLRILEKTMNQLTQVLSIPQGFYW